MQLLPYQLAIANLKGEVCPSERGYMSREEAIQMLREESGVDFGENIEEWEAWVERWYAGAPKKDACD